MDLLVMSPTVSLHLIQHPTPKEMAHPQLKVTPTFNPKPKSHFAVTSLAQLSDGTLPRGVTSISLNLQDLINDCSESKLTANQVTKIALTVTSIKQHIGVLT